MCNGDACDSGRHRFKFLQVGRTPFHESQSSDDHLKGVFNRCYLYRRTENTSMALSGSLYSEQFAGNLSCIRMCHASSRNSIGVSDE